MPFLALTGEITQKPIAFIHLSLLADSWEKQHCFLDACYVTYYSEHSILNWTDDTKKVAHTRLQSIGFAALGSQPAGDVSHKPGSRLPLLSARPPVIPATLKRAATNFAAWWMGVNSLPNSVTRQRHDCNLNPGPSVPDSSTLTTRLPSHPQTTLYKLFHVANLQQKDVSWRWLPLTASKWLLDEGVANPYICNNCQLASSP